MGKLWIKRGLDLEIRTRWYLLASQSDAVIYSSKTSPPGVIQTFKGESTIDRHAAEVFAAEIAAFVENAHQQKRFGTLVVAAEPRFLGLLRGKLSSEVKAKIRTEIAKEFVPRLGKSSLRQIMKGDHHANL